MCSSHYSHITAIVSVGFHLVVHGSLHFHCSCDPLIIIMYVGIGFGHKKNNVFLSGFTQIVWFRLQALCSDHDVIVYMLHVSILVVISACPDEASLRISLAGSLLFYNLGIYISKMKMGHHAQDYCYSGILSKKLIKNFSHVPCVHNDL